jgi:hypothetical protein
MWADFRFVDALYAHGIAGSFDALSIHPYSDDRSPLDPGSDAWTEVSFVRGVPAVREAMLAHGDARPVWLTEFGWSSNALRDAASWQNGVSEADQATYVAQALTQMRDWAYVEAAIYYDLVDAGSDPRAPIENFGLVRHDLRPKPAFDAFRRAAAGLGPTVQSFRSGQ